MDKKIYTQKFKEVFEVVCNRTILHPITALNLSYTYNKGEVQKIKKNLYFPRLVQKKAGIGSLPGLQCSTPVKQYNTIFNNIDCFCTDLKSTLHPKVYKELAKNKNNPQLQLQILRKVGL
jgi:hypothetical protein